MKSGHAVVIIAVCGFILSSCALVEMSGRATRRTGEAMEEYAEQNDGLLARMAGIGGRINTAVGSAVERISGKGSTDREKLEVDQPGGEQIVDGAPASDPPPEEQVHAVSDREVAVEPPSEVIVEQDLSDDPDEKMSITEMQGRLIELGYKPGPIDGLMGPKSSGALKKFQKDNRLPATGRLDGNTISRLRNANHLKAAP